MIKFTKADLLPFLFAQIDKIVENTNKYLFAILYKCIYCIPLMNLWKFHRDQIKNCRLSVIIFFLKLIFENFVRPDEYQKTTKKYFCAILYTYIYYNPPINFVRPDEYFQHQWIFVYTTLYSYISLHYNLQQNILPGWGYQCVGNILVY